MNNTNPNVKDLFLVTTALQDTWPENNKSVLFLGEWCRLYSQKSRWENLSGEVAPYHWDDRDKLYKDYKYLLKLFEKVLESLVVELNNTHNVRYSSRYWRLLIGPWLMSFLTIIFDRWSCIKIVVDKYSIENTKILRGVNLNHVPLCMEHYSNIVTTDLWNHAIYASILKYLKFEKISFCKHSLDLPKWPKKQATKKRDIIFRIKHFIVNCLSFFSRNKNYFFISTYTSKFDLIKLQLMLGQIPIFYQEPNYVDLIPQEINRNISLSGFKYKTVFEQYVKEVVPLQIPKVYLEGYKNLLKLSKSNNWPKEPKLIWTSNSFYMDEMFKFWAGDRIEEGVPLVIGQHGGNYGQALFNMGEYHELKICDYYLSWGWKSKTDKVIPIGIFKKSLNNKRRLDDNVSILLILSVACRYNSGIQSIPASSQWIDYLDDQIEFYEKLPDYVSNNVTVRLYPHDFQWSQFERWKEKFPNSKIDECEKDLDKAVKNTNLLISGWNTTAYLESMMSNIPTIIFWEPKYFEIRKDARDDFEKLKKVGIFHENPVSAVKHIKKIWGNIDLWWNLPDVTLARNEFTLKYANSNNVLGKLFKFFKDIS
jgi:putative transferase (TIGR04331 family)